MTTRKQRGADHDHFRQMYSLETRLYLTVLLAVFVVLKLTGTIDWSWWWVLAPFWIPLVVAVLAVGVMIVMLWRERRR